MELIKQQSDTHLLLIGPVTAAWYYNEILAAAEMLGVKERLTVIPGFKPDSVELLQALKTAYCFVLPSRHEPFGIAALEALDIGKTDVLRIRFLFEAVFLVESINPTARINQLLLAGIEGVTL